MTAWLRFCLGVALLVVAYAVYYHLVAVPSKEKDERVLDDIVREQQLTTCLATAEEIYNGNWEKDCKILDREIGCALPNSNAERWDTIKKEARAECYKRYPVGQ